MGEERLSDLAVIHVHYDFVFKMDEIIDQFAKKKDIRRSWLIRRRQQAERPKQAEEKEEEEEEGSIADY